jgi:hypothetical protein
MASSSIETGTISHRRGSRRKSVSAPLDTMPVGNDLVVTVATDEYLLPDLERMRQLPSAGPSQRHAQQRGNCRRSRYEELPPKCRLALGLTIMNSRCYPSDLDTYVPAENGPANRMGHGDNFAFRKRPDFVLR